MTLTGIMISALWMCNLLLLVSGLPLRQPSLRFRRSFGQSSLGYGGGVSFTANLHPYNMKNPIDFAYGLGFGYGLDAGGQQFTNAIVATGSGGNGVGQGNGYGGVMNGFGYGSGNANTILAASPGYSQSYTNNMAFSGNQGNGYGQGGATGAIVPQNSWGFSSPYQSYGYRY